MTNGEMDYLANRKLWVDALRSNKYEQCTGLLCRISDDGLENKSFCCLGVACDLYNKHNPNELDIDIEYNGSRQTYDNIASYLPDRVAKWLNITVSGNMCKYNTTGNDSLMGMNDNGYSFNEISIEIENNNLLPYSGE